MQLYCSVGIFWILICFKSATLNLWTVDPGGSTKAWINHKGFYSKTERKKKKEKEMKNKKTCFLVMSHEVMSSWIELYYVSSLPACSTSQNYLFVFRMLSMKFTHKRKTRFMGWESQSQSVWESVHMDFRVITDLFKVIIFLFMYGVFNQFLKIKVFCYCLIKQLFNFILQNS